MRAEIEVIQPGLFSTIQDRGRFGFLKFGVPMSGPMDTYASGFGNLILNNNPEDPVLEITQTGPALKFQSEAFIVISGACLTPDISGKKIHNNRISHVKAGELLSFGKRNYGARSYLAIKGGFIGEKVLNSYSWYEGITSHFRLEKGMKLQFYAGHQEYVPPYAVVRFDMSYLNISTLPVYAGPEFEKLSLALQKKICSQFFSVDRSSNRMAIQLKEIFENSIAPIITGPVIPGTVQLTPSGKLIVLMRDCQTTGGYPRVLQLGKEGLNILAQKIPGDRIQFNLITGIPIR